MGLQDDLDRVKLQFIRAAEQLIAADKMPPEAMENVLQLLDAIDADDEKQVLALLDELGGQHERLLPLLGRWELFRSDGGTKPDA